MNLDKYFFTMSATRVTVQDFKTPINGQIIYCFETGFPYKFNSSSALAADGVYVLAATDGTSGRWEASGLAAGALALTSPPSGAGITVNYNGRVQRVAYKLTTTYVAWQAAALTKDINLFVTKPRERIVACYTDTTVAYAGLGSTITLRVGSTAGGQQIIVDHDVKTAPVTKGLVDADLGTSFNRANAIQGAFLPIWAGSGVIQSRMTSGSGNLSGLNAGSTTFYIETEVFE